MKTKIETIETKIKRLNYLYATKVDKEEVERLKREIEYFYYGLIIYNGSK